MPLVSLGPFTFSSGWNPTKIDGPKRDSYLVEHAIPGREGGIPEYLGSPQPTWQLKGFLAPNPDAPTGVAGAQLSGSGYVGLSPDSAMNYLKNLRGSGVSLLKIESTYSMMSGVQVFYENDFYYVSKMTFGLEAGRGFPYYPYGIDLKRASYRTFGNNSGTTVWPGTLVSGNVAGYLSGYMIAYNLPAGSGAPTTTALLVGIGVYALAAASGNIQLGIYQTASLQAQSAVQPITSGWNYFPVNPSFTVSSGTVYTLALIGTSTGASGWVLACAAETGFSQYIASGRSFTSGFPATQPTTFPNASGYALDIVMVTA